MCIKTCKHTHTPQSGWLLRNKIVRYFLNHTVIDMVEVWKETLRYMGKNMQERAFLMLFLCLPALNVIASDVIY